MQAKSRCFVFLLNNRERFQIEEWNWTPAQLKCFHRGRECSPGNPEKYLEIPRVIRLILFSFSNSPFRFKFLVIQLTLSMLLAQESGAFFCSGQDVGQGCSLFCQCRAGLSCQPGVHKCYHVPRKLGEPCAAGHPCAPGFYCQYLAHKCEWDYGGWGRAIPHTKCWRLLASVLLCLREKNWGIFFLKVAALKQRATTKPGLILLKICV